MDYIYLRNQTVQEIIPEENPLFPGVPVTERYAPDFLARCVEVQSAEGIHEGMLYDSETGTFSEPPVPESERTVGPETDAAGADTE